ncbi:MAG TPA: formylglycine-generating enzyme family protein [Tepidisphaeraceae bacterium]|jgi:formylglycine-generating enzyme required for sulfatase activity
MNSRIRDRKRPAARRAAAQQPLGGGLLRWLSGGAILAAVVLCAYGWKTSGRQATAAKSEAVPKSGAASQSGMRWIPGAEYVMGTDDPKSLHNERPAHRVRVDGFWMDVHDVTNGEFRRFVDATGYVTTAERKPQWEEIRKQLPPGTPRPDDAMLVAGALVFTPTDHAVDLRDLSQWWRWVPGASWRHPHGPGSDIAGKDDYPVVQVSWDDAGGYAKWAGKRLPTEAEWEYAARGGKYGTRYYWGDEFRPGGRFMCNTFTGLFPVKDTGEDGFAGPSPVGAFPPNGYGLYDMAGNVWQWCSDWYRADMHAQNAQTDCCVNPAGPSESLDPNEPYMPKRVVKGGSFLCSDSYCESYRPTARRGTPPDTGTNHTGFRCAKSAEPKEVN